MSRKLGNKEKSKISERRLAERFGGRVQPASGALPVKSLKGDVVTKHFVIDDKVTEKDVYSLKADLFRKLRQEAFVTRRRPAIRINFQSGLEVFVVSAADFELLNQKLG